MTKQELLLKVATDEDYKRYCKHLCNGRFIHEDLFQEFFIIISGLDEAKLLDIFSRGKIREYCNQVIFSLKNSRKRKKENAMTELTSSCQQVFDAVDEVEEYNHSIDTMHDEVVSYGRQTHDQHFEFLQQSIEQTKRSIARERGIPEITVYKAVDRMKSKIRNHFTNQPPAAPAGLNQSK